jgi:hypothetical protein
LHLTFALKISFPQDIEKISFEMFCPARENYSNAGCGKKYKKLIFL